MYRCTYNKFKHVCRSWCRYCILFYPILAFYLKFAKENQDSIVLPRVNIKDTKDISEDNVTATLKRALRFHSTLQASDGHWPGDYGGPMFLLPGLVSLKFTTSCYFQLYQINLKMNLDQYTCIEHFVNFNDILLHLFSITSCC